MTTPTGKNRNREYRTNPRAHLKNVEDPNQRIEARKDPSRGWDRKPHDLTGAGNRNLALTYEGERNLFNAVMGKALKRWETQKKQEERAKVEKAKEEEAKAQIAAAGRLRSTPRADVQVLPTIPEAVPLEVPGIQVPSVTLDVDIDTLVEQVAVALNADPSSVSSSLPSTLPESGGADVRVPPAVTEAVSAKKPIVRIVDIPRGANTSALVAQILDEVNPNPSPISISLPPSACKLDDDGYSVWRYKVRDALTKSKLLKKNEVIYCMERMDDATNQPQSSIDFSLMRAQADVKNELRAFALWRSGLKDQPARHPHLTHVVLPSGLEQVPSYLNEFKHLEALFIPGGDALRQIKVARLPKLKKLVVVCLADADLDKPSTKLQFGRTGRGREMVFALTPYTSRLPEDAGNQVEPSLETAARKEFVLEVGKACQEVMLLSVGSEEQLATFASSCSEAMFSLGDDEILRPRVRKALEKMNHALRWDLGTLDLSDCTQDAIQFIVENNLAQNFVAARSTERRCITYTASKPDQPVSRTASAIPPLEVILPANLSHDQVTAIAAALGGT